MVPAPLPPARSFRRRLALLAGLWAFLVLVALVCRSALLPFAGAALIAYVAAPLVKRLARVRVGGRPVARWVAILLIYAAFFGVVYLFVIGIVPQLYRELVRISTNVVGFANSLTPARTQQIARDTEGWLSSHGVPVALSARALEGADAEEESTGRPQWSFSFDLERVVRETAARLGSMARANLGNIVTMTRNLLVGLFTALFTIFFMLMVAAFMSIDAQTIRRYCRTLVPPEWAEEVAGLVHRIDLSLSGVVRGQLTICMVNGTLTFVGLVLFGVKFAFLLATVATVLSLIPIFGTIISSVPIVTMGLAQSWKAGLGMLVWIFGIHALEAYFLNPRIMGSAARIHPVVVAFALIAGERTYGLIGALFAVPISAVLVACFEFVRQRAQA